MGLHRLPPRKTGHDHEYRTTLGDNFVDQLKDVWVWSAIRSLEMAALLAAYTHEGDCNCPKEDGSYNSGQDFSGDNTAHELRELVEALAGDIKMLRGIEK